MRMLLVPAFMRVMGRFNWWAPKPLARLHERFPITSESHLRDAAGRVAFAGAADTGFALAQRHSLGSRCRL